MNESYYPVLPEKTKFHVEDKNQHVNSVPMDKEYDDFPTDNFYRGYEQGSLFSTNQLGIV